jgi:hypothetical protein
VLPLDYFFFIPLAFEAAFNRPPDTPAAFTAAEAAPFLAGLLTEPPPLGICIRDDAGRFGVDFIVLFFSLVLNIDLRLGHPR